MSAVTGVYTPKQSRENLPLKGDYGHKNGGSVGVHGYVGMLLNVENDLNELISVSDLDNCGCCFDALLNIQLFIAKIPAHEECRFLI